MFDKSLCKSKKPEYYHQEREEMLKFVAPDVKFVLDVGCSAGGFGKLLKKKRNCIVWGVEPTDSAIEASKHLDKVYHDFFHSSLDFGNLKFDAIVFNDVLEHLVDPWQTSWNFYLLNVIALASWNKSFVVKKGHGCLFS